MLNELNERLIRAKERLRTKRKLEAMLRQAQGVVEQEKLKCSTLKDRLAEEKADVDKLEGLSMTGLFYSVLGTKEARLERERQEFLGAKLKHEEAVESLADAQQEVRRLLGELEELTGADAAYDGLLEEKEKRLRGSGDGRAHKLLEISDQLADVTADRKELQEAVQAGQAALNALQRVSSELSSAANWGTWDMLGGGMLATMAKHSKIDAAKQHAHYAQRQIRRFQEELADSDQRLRVTLDIGGFSKFADYFFDGLIADWVVQSRIQEASSACSSTISQISSAVNNCKRRLRETDLDIQKLEQARNEYIEQA